MSKIDEAIKILEAVRGGKELDNPQKIPISVDYCIHTLAGYEIKPEPIFEKGERVWVKDVEDNDWYPAIYHSKKDEHYYEMGKGGGDRSLIWQQCIKWEEYKL